MMNATAFILLVYLALLSAGQYTNPAFTNTSGPTGPIIDLGYTTVQGTRTTFGDFQANAWLGIRYASPPTGALRLSVPEPVDSNVKFPQSFDATSFGPYCYQGVASAYTGKNAIPNSTLGIGNRQPDEDCLLLDIYAPLNPTSNYLPVLFYIHGGGYVQGCSTFGVRPGDILNSLPGEVIVVSIQYRLAGFGFLGGSQIADSGALNAGLQDQRLALSWIQRHISSFGGDPDRVILNGGSAGGGSVLYQLLWNGGEQNPPYQTAIAEFPAISPILNSTGLEVQYQQVLSAANCSDIGCLRSLSGEEYAKAQQTVLTQGIGYAYGTFYYAPFVDGKFIQNLPSIEMGLGNIASVPLLTTRDGNEGYLFTPQNITANTDYEARVRTLFNGQLSFFGQLDLFYPPTSPAGPYAYNDTQQRAEWIIGDAFIGCPSQYAASAATNCLSKTDEDPPVWKFVWAYPSYSSAYHGSYYPYVFTAHQYNVTDESPVAQIARYLTQYYVSFILHSDPNAGVNSTDSGTPWPRYGAESQILLIGSDGGLSNVTDPDTRPQCQFLQAHPNNVGS